MASVRRAIVLVAVCLANAACVPMLVEDTAGARGRVIDRQSSNGIPNAKICAKYSTALCAYTDSAGLFDLQPVTRTEWRFFMMEVFPYAGRGQFTIEAPGYGPQEVTIMDYVPITVMLAAPSRANQ